MNAEEISIVKIMKGKTIMKSFISLGAAKFSSQSSCTLKTITIVIENPERSYL